MQSLNIGMTGASGLIGSLLGPVLTAQGHRVTSLVRRRPRQGELQWSGPGFRLPAVDLLGFDAIIHLAGENIGVRWTAARKREIMASRVEGTGAMARAMAEAVSQGGPRILLAASATGYYGDRGDEAVTETSPPGSGFLAEVVQAWEAASTPAEVAGIRVVRLRMGIPLTPRGGALARLLVPFRLGVGGRIGTGRQWMSWISPDDLVEVYLFALGSDTLAGAVNAVAPEPVTNAEFTRTLAEVLHRPALFPVPAAALQLLYGEMAEETILASTRVRPARLLDQGFAFRFPALEAALRHELGS
jgi:uncharacterized protein (TIGR01777 family)